MLYLLAIAITMFYRFRMNDALATADPAQPDAARIWASYAGPWTFWNHVRCGAALAAATLLTLALERIRRYSTGM